MKNLIPLLCILAVFLNTSCAGMSGDIGKSLGGSKGELDLNTIVAGLKEALSVGTDKTVKNISGVDGFFGNKVIKILMPDNIQKVADVLGKLGFQGYVDEFVLGMNRAAENASSKATPIFVDAIKGMSFEDAKKILNGGDTAATDYFKKKTSKKLFNEFKPVISSSMDKVGAAKSYKEMISKYEAIPFVDNQSLDIDNYVTDKALDGLFRVLGEEEKKIRKNPAARVTDLLKKVFGK